MKPIRTPQHLRWATCSLVVMLVALLLVMAAGSALAMPRDPIDPPPIKEPVDNYPVPDNGFDWSMPSRYGLYQNGIVDFHWVEADALTGGHYEPNHVNPNEFIVLFDGCRTWDDEETGTSAMTYRWTIDGQVTEGLACRVPHAFATQGTFTATLRITRTDGTVLLDDQGRGNPFTQSIVVKDFLIVSIGDSYASGEGNPDRWQVLGGSDILGQPTHVETEAVWQDKRCHRSAYAAPAQAARLLEMADPHTSVTFLSFACSSATINTHTYDDAPIWDPYRSPPDWPLVKDRGTGVLGPGCGQEPPNRDRPQDNQLPSQISQVVTALTNNGTIPARPVDALLISAGGNDMGFVPIIQLCALYWECETDVLVTSQDGEGLSSLQTRAADDVNALPAKYDALAAEIEEHIPFSPNGRVYITQYPDPTRDSSGAHCDEMLTDIIPWWVSAGATLGTGWDTVFGTAYTVPLPPHRMDQNEDTWAGDVVGPTLNAKIAAAATTHEWVLVDGINDSTGNLFATHGYCAADNWIRTATESVDIQGPWSHWLWPSVWPAASIKTTGTMHPTADGNLAVAQRIMAKMGPILLPGGDPAVPPTFTSTSNNAIVSTSGWFTGHEAGATCPAGAADCSFAQVVATSAADTAISGASLVVDGVPVACSPTGVTAGSLTCQAELTTPQSYTWSLAFAADGIYQLAFSASSDNGASATFSRQVKVDLTNPVASHELSAPPVASGSYLIPVTITVSAADGAGSGPAAIEYELDGETFVTDGNGAVVGIDTTGEHNLTYRAVDNAGRTSPWQTLSVTAVALTVTIDAVTNANEGDVISLGSSVAGAGDAEQLTYDWRVTSYGVEVATSNQANFTLTAADSGPLDVSLTVAEMGGGQDTATHTIYVANVAPTPSITGAPTTNSEGAAITLGSSVTDPGTADTFSYAWSVTFDREIVASGANTDFSFTPGDNGPYEVSLTVTDDDGGPGTAIQTIDVLNVAPAATILDAPAGGTEGAAITLSGSATDPGAADTLYYDWTVKKDEVIVATGTGAGFSFTPDDNGSYEVSLTVTDDDDGLCTTGQTIEVTNAAPALSNVTVSPGAVDEGGSVTLAGSISDAGSADSFSLTIDWGDGGTAEVVSLNAGSTSFSRSHTYADDNPTATVSDTYAIGLSIADDDGGTGAGSASVVVKNLPPAVTVSAPEDGTLYQVNAAVGVSASLADASNLDTLTCSVNWGDGVVGPGTLAAGLCTASHSYPAAGVYTVRMTGTDDDTGAGTDSVLVVVYDPSAGFVTGGGWLASPAGAYKPDRSLSGRATFGFISKYNKGAQVPTGNTQFQFDAADFSFYSDAYEWLVVNQGGTNAQFKGSGLVNEAADPNGNAFKFMVWATDGTPDSLRIRIWWEANGVENDVYDNGAGQAEQAIGGGNIVIHKSK